MSEATNAVVKPAATRREAKADVTNRIALQIINAETAKREAKTRRLRKARIARETAEALAMDPAPSKRKTSG